MAHRAPPQDDMDGSGGGSRGGTPVPLRFALVNPEAVAGPAVIAVTVGSADELGAREMQSSTPARLTRALTPLKGRRVAREVAGLSALQQEQPAMQERVERISRRKLRRRNNDRLLGVPAAHRSVTEDEAVPPLEWRPSALSKLTKDLRDRFVEGSLRIQTHASGKGTGRKPYSAVRDGQERFLRLDRRLRSVLVKSIESESLLPLMEAMEELLRAWQCDVLPSQHELPGVLRDALEAPVRRVGPPCEPVLAFPLRNSPFFRLLVHGLAQYHALRSRSEDVEGIRCVLVSKAKLQDIVCVMPLTTFIRLHWHRRLSSRDEGRVLGGRSGRSTESGEDDVQTIKIDH